MTYLLRTVVVMISALLSFHVYAFELNSPELTQDGTFGDHHAACIFSPSQKQIVFGENISPALNWNNPPKNTKSFALLLLDPDVPLDRSTVNVPGKTILSTAPRRTAYHWILIDIPNTVYSIAAGMASTKPINENKSIKNTKHTWANIVSYEDKTALSSSYVGPCPPSNDERIHHYIFTLYALNVPTVPENLTEETLIHFINEHTLKQARLVVKRTNNPGLKGG